MTQFQMVTDQSPFLLYYEIRNVIIDAVYIGKQCRKTRGFLPTYMPFSSFSGDSSPIFRLAHHICLTVIQYYFLSVPKCLVLMTQSPWELAGNILSQPLLNLHYLLRNNSSTPFCFSFFLKSDRYNVNLLFNIEL